MALNPALKPSIAAHPNNRKWKNDEASTVKIIKKTRNIEKTKKALLNSNLALIVLLQVLQICCLLDKSSPNDNGTSAL
jgi:hypothetical protein